MFQRKSFVIIYTAIFCYLIAGFSVGIGFLSEERHPKDGNCNDLWIASFVLMMSFASLLFAGVLATIFDGIRPVIFVLILGGIVTTIYASVEYNIGSDYCKANWEREHRHLWIYLNVATPLQLLFFSVITAFLFIDTLCCDRPLE